MHSISKKQTSHVDAARIRFELLSRFNPLRGMTPQKAVRLLEEFDRGILREAAWAFEKIESHDDMAKTVASKRKKAPSRQPWFIAAAEGWEDRGNEKALNEQTEFLQHLFNTVRCTHALDRNQQGGLRLAINQMCDAIGKKYAVHELDWRPQRDGNLEVGMSFTPLWFFENTTGLLRFLPRGQSQSGEDLDPLGWMVTVGDGLMVATTVAYLYKTLPLKDWLTYSERCGMPFPTMATDAQYGTAEWDDAVAALNAIAAEFGAVHSRDAELKIHDLKGSGELPYPRLIERMDRAIAMLWRGSDLSTMSGRDQMGASLQQDESDILVEDDVEMINETLHHQITLPALRWRFGRDVQILCRFELHSPDRLDEKAEQEKLHRAADYGVKIPVNDYKERLSIPMAEGDEEALVLIAPGQITAVQTAEKPDPELKADANADAEPMAIAVAEDFAAFRALVEAHLDEPQFDPDALLRDIKSQLPELFKAMSASGQTEEFLRDQLATQIVAGVLSVPPVTA